MVRVNFFFPCQGKSGNMVFVIEIYKELENSGTSKISCPGILMEIQAEMHINLNLNGPSVVGVGGSGVQGQHPGGVATKPPTPNSVLTFQELRMVGNWAYLCPPPPPLPSVLMFQELRMIGNWAYLCPL